MADKPTNTADHECKHPESCDQHNPNSQQNGGDHIAVETAVPDINTEQNNETPQTTSADQLEKEMTKLDKKTYLPIDVVVDKIIGGVYGLAIAEVYSTLKKEGINEIDTIRNNTSQLINVLDVMCEKNGFDVKAFAQRLYTANLQNANIDNYCRSLCADEKFVSEPEQVAFEQYSAKSKDNENTGYNTVLCRMLPLCLHKEWDIFTFAACMSTHFDHRCISGSLLMTSLFRNILIGKPNNFLKCVQETIYTIILANKMVDKYYISEMYRYTSEVYIANPTLVGANVGFTSHVYKTLCLALHALYLAEHIIHRINNTFVEDTVGVDTKDTKSEAKGGVINENEENKDEAESTNNDYVNVEIPKKKTKKNKKSKKKSKTGKMESGKKSTITKKKNSNNGLLEDIKDKSDIFENVVNVIYELGGDVVNNCAISGYLIGTELGYKLIPNKLIQLIEPFKKKLDEYLISYLKYMNFIKSDSTTIENIEIVSIEESIKKYMEKLEKEQANSQNTTAEPQTAEVEPQTTTEVVAAAAPADEGDTTAQQPLNNDQEEEIVGDYVEVDGHHDKPKKGG